MCVKMCINTERQSPKVVVSVNFLLKVEQTKYDKGGYIISLTVPQVDVSFVVDLCLCYNVLKPTKDIKKIVKHGIPIRRLITDLIEIEDGLTDSD